MPEKNGATVMVGDCCVVVPVVVEVVATLVTKNSSVPTFSTAFWLLIVATRGLDSTCTDPCVSRNWISAAKFAVCSARPNTLLAGLLAESAAVDATIALPAVSTATPSPLSGVPRAASVVADLPMLTWPRAPELLKTAQLMPLWKLSASVTSMIFASSITWRSTDRRVSRRYCSTPRSSSGIARITTIPECAVTTTLRPGALPMIDCSELRSSVQKSLVCMVETRLESIERATGNCPGASVPGTGAAPAPGAPCPCPGESATEPD